MTLLPKDSKEFGSKDYWNSFFANRGNDPFEWYGQYTELCGLLHTYIRPADALLVAGCGNSTISADLYRVGYKTITNVDVSEVVIRQMRSKYEVSCPDMTWCHDDLTQSQFSSESFSCVLDKGTLDAIFTDDSPSVKETVNKYLKEIGRLLRVGGRLVCVSLLQEHILHHLLEWGANNAWIVRLCRCEEAERATKSKGKFTLPVFVIVCTKLKPMPGMAAVVQCQLSTAGPATHTTAGDLQGRVRALQQYSAITHALLQKVASGEEARLELCEPTSGELRYVLYILDEAVAGKTKPKLPMGVFIVPQRRECEWLFGSSEGRRQVLASCGAGRLAVVHLQRGQTYADGLQQVQDELSATVLDLVPRDMPAGFKVPFLSVGGDVGSARRVARGSSEWCGEYVVEDVQGDQGEVLRRLVFLDNPNVVQSEVRLKQVNTKPVNNHKKSNKSKKLTAAGVVVDHSWLSCRHHLAMVAGLGLVKREARVLLVGLGGGPLATYISNNLPKVHVEAVELDPAMVDVAREWFGFKSGPRMEVTVMDGLDCCRQRAQTGVQFDCMMLDVDSKDLSVGMSCPPQAFVEEDFLRTMAACLAPQGVLILNVVCRDTGVWQACVERLQHVFGRVLCQAVPNEVNRVLFCRREQQNEAVVPKDELTNGDAIITTVGDGKRHQLTTEQNINDVGKKIKKELVLSEEQEGERLMREFKTSIEKINNALKSKNNGKDLLDVKELLTCTNIL